VIKNQQLRIAVAATSQRRVFAAGFCRPHACATRFGMNPA
jgi:hypothetical protein